MASLRSDASPVAGQEGRLEPFKDGTLSNDGLRLTLIMLCSALPPLPVLIEIVDSLTAGSPSRTSVVWIETDDRVRAGDIETFPAIERYQSQVVWHWVAIPMPSHHERQLCGRGGGRTGGTMDSCCCTMTTVPAAADILGLGHTPAGAAPALATAAKSPRQARRRHHVCIRTTGICSNY